MEVDTSSSTSGVQDRLKVQATVVFDPSSPRVAGYELWRLRAYASENIQGTGVQSQRVDQVLSTSQQSRPITFSDTGSAYIDFSDVFVEMDITDIGCGANRFLCFDFMKGDRPTPDFSFASPQQADTSKFTVCQEIACSAQGWLNSEHYC